MDESSKAIEQQLTLLLRRVQRTYVPVADGTVELDRSGYGILCRLADHGPQRLGSIAHTFGLDPSTITRQVQALERAGLARRTNDADDRRAFILDLTSTGRSALTQTRRRRRQQLHQLVSSWPEADRTEFARLLTLFNESVEQLPD